MTRSKMLPNMTCLLRISKNDINEFTRHVKYQLVDYIIDYIQKTYWKHPSKSQKKYFDQKRMYLRAVRSLHIIPLSIIFVLYHDIYILFLYP